MSDEHDQNTADEGAETPGEDPSAEPPTAEPSPSDSGAEASDDVAAAPVADTAAGGGADAPEEAAEDALGDASEEAAEDAPGDAPEEAADAASDTAPEREVTSVDAAAPNYEDRPDAPIPIDPGFRLQLPGFEGPLDLLLFLIRKHELDILDLPIAFICQKYAEYIKLMEELNLDVASEYLVMAATLAHIKSKELLPRPPLEQDDDDEDEVDPRAELIRRLLEYQKYKRAAEQLGAFGVAGRDVFPRGIPAPKAEGPAPLAEISVFKLIDAFQRIVKRREGKISLEVDAERVTIQERMSQITEALQHRERLSFEELFEGYATTYDLVVTFLALLEMAKSRLTRIYQTEPEGPIYLEARILKVDDHGPGDEPSPESTSDTEQGLARSHGAAAVTEEEADSAEVASDDEAEWAVSGSESDADATESAVGDSVSASESAVGESESASESAVGESESGVVESEPEPDDEEETDPLDSAGVTDQDPDGR